MKQKILIVEDETPIVNFINNRLDSNLYEVDIAMDGQEAINKLMAKNYDLITLDIMLPSVDGYEICKVLRKRSKHTLIIMISAMDTEEFKEKGYECGVDDYIPKPFSAKELAVKIKAFLKRRSEIAGVELKHTKYLSKFTFNDELKQILINGFELNFTPSEYLILLTMLNNLNRVYSRSDLAQLIYDNYLGEIDERGIDSHIYHIRKKIKPYEEKEMIKTVRGMGYKIDDEN